MVILTQACVRPPYAISFCWLILSDLMCLHFWNFFCTPFRMQIFSLRMY